MLARTIGRAVIGLALLAAQGLQAQPPGDSVDALARDVDRLESLRAAKDLQLHYAHYLQYGLWADAADLFADNATVDWAGQAVTGKAAIRAWLAARGGGRTGLAPGALASEFIDEPLFNLSADGESAKGRWMSMAFRGDGKGRAWFEGGIYENDYVREGGRWKIAAMHYFPQFEGPYAEGWRNVGGQDLAMFPYHFTVEQAGVPIPTATGPAPNAGANLTTLARRIAVLNDEDAVRNVQYAYGYYVDRRMWDDVVDLFSSESAVEMAGKIMKGKDGIRQSLEQAMGPAGLSHGVLNERPLFDVVVRILPGGAEAVARGFELAMLGEADKGKAGWEINVLRNRFVKDAGVWKLKELRVYPLMKSDYATGWGGGALPGRARPTFAAMAGAHPVRDGKAPDVRPLTGAIAPGPVPSATSLADLRRRYARSLAYEGAANVVAAYGYYIDDFQWTEMADVIALKGNKSSPFAGYYLGRDRIRGAVNASYGPASALRSGIAFHWRTQPVIMVSQDGRSANVRTRLFQPRTSKSSAGTLNSGMYPNEQAVLEDGVWKLWSVTIDEHYFVSPNWKEGWNGAKDLPPGQKDPPSPLLTRYPPDIPLTALGAREEGFRGGVGQAMDWPAILPMWFNYRNPVSGRVPERYWPDCVPCTMLPQASMTNQGYQMPPTGPQIDGVDLAATP